MRVLDIRMEGHKDEKQKWLSYCSGIWESGKIHRIYIEECAFLWCMKWCKGNVGLQNLTYDSILWLFVSVPDVSFDEIYICT